MFTVNQRYGGTDRQTDERKTYDSNLYRTIAPRDIKRKCRPIEVLLAREEGTSAVIYQELIASALFLAE